MTCPNSEFDLQHAIVVLECSDNVIYTVLDNIIAALELPGGLSSRMPRTIKVKGGQDVPRGCFGCTKKSQIEAKWGLKPDPSPASTHVCQHLPPLYSLFFT